MQPARRRYVQYITRAYKRTGTLRIGRFKSSAVQEERNFLLCSRYVELNPVRAGMVADPGQYRWSSYRHNGLGQPDERLTAHAEYVARGKTDHDRPSSYRSLFRTELDEEAITDIRLALAQGQPLGNDRFSETLGKAAGIRQAQVCRGRPAKPANKASGLDGKQTGFGF